jgi:dipeptidyl aminopeptidase/acylaminoacyl peptidase
MRHTFLVAAFASLAACLPAQTPAASATPASTVLTPEQALKVRRISDLNFSPDGSRLVCVVSEPPKGETPVTHLWMLDVARSDFRQFTYSTKSESSPRWSPDGKALAFLSSRGEKMQIYLIRMDGGEAAALTSGKNAVGEFRWSPDGSQIAFLAKEPPTEAEEKKDKDKDDAKVSDRELDLNRLWVIDISTKKVRQVTKGAWRIDQFEWVAPDRLLAVASNKPKEETWNQSLYTVSTADGTFTLFGRPAQPFGGITVSPKRTTLSFVGPRNAGPSPHDLYLQSTSGGEARNVTASIDRDVRGVKWQDDSTVYAIVPNGFYSRLIRVPVNGPPQLVEMPGLAGSFDVTRDGALAFVGGGFNQLNELFLKVANHNAVQISHLQEADWKGIKLADAELFTYMSFDGTPIQAALMKPVGSTGKLPLILYVHGGPAGKFSADYQSWAQLLVSRGFQLLIVNPRGSSGYGEEFLKANKADWGGGDFKDLMAGVDAVIARGQTDPDRLGIGGWSYGGYMAEWAITQTNRFKAAVSGAGMFDLAAEFGTEVGPEGDEWYFGTPWEHPDRFIHSSPYTYIKNARTPTLILQGENDPIDPVGQSTALYRALKRYGVETELVVYPREPHGPREEKHQLDVLTRMTGWFDRYLKRAK